MKTRDPDSGPSEKDRTPPDISPVQPAPAFGAPIEDSKDTPFILLVERDEGLRLSIRNTLESKGFYVFSLRDPVIASELVGKFPGDLLLLMTEIELPRLRGCGLAAYLRTIHPGIKVLYMSASIKDPEVLNDMRLGRAGFIAKPFNPGELMEAVKLILGDEPQNKA